MNDPKDKQPHQWGENKENEPTEDSANKGNWDPHQQIDEEGNEIGPDDIK